MSKNKHIFQFKIVLTGTDPAIWRRIQVPGSYTFWDLHVAIQDSMGWKDCHLHHFKLKRPHKRKATEIGIFFDADLDGEVPPLVAWETYIENEFPEPGRTAEYLYDFGDDWTHKILLEGILLREKGQSYPKCIDGARACPPEDCGGIGGFENFQNMMADPSHEEHDEMMDWYGKPFDPEAFSPDQIKFDNPQKRWRSAFKHSNQCC